MPNWAEGTIKIRGTKENIENFLKSELLGNVYPIFSKNDDGTPNTEYGHKDVEITKNTWGDLKISCEGGFYIKNSIRAFIECSTIEPDFDERDIEQLEIDGFKQAWGVIPENYVKASEKYNLDIKIFAFERGMEFWQEVEISNGEIIKDITNEYSDYFWDVPFARLGG